MHKLFSSAWKEGKGDSVPLTHARAVEDTTEFFLTFFYYLYINLQFTTKLGKKVHSTENRLTY